MISLVVKEIEIIVNFQIILRNKIYLRDMKRISTVKLSVFVFYVDIISGKVISVIISEVEEAILDKHYVQRG